LTHCVACGARAVAAAAGCAEEAGRSRVCARDTGAEDENSSDKRIAKTEILRFTEKTPILQLKEETNKCNTQTTRKQNAGPSIWLQ
jgi:hypothetical protein